MMMKTIKPSGVYVNDKLVQYRYIYKDRYYIVDKAYNLFEISKEDYMKLNCPVRKKKESEEEYEIN